MLSVHVRKGQNKRRLVELGEKVRARRIALGLQQKELSYEMIKRGCEKAYPTWVSNLECGKLSRPQTSEFIEALAEILKMDINELREANGKRKVFPR